jgi:hypothetical protein
VSFESLGGPFTLGGTQPMLTLNGCSSVTFRGFNGTFTTTASAIVITGTTSDCVFTGCNFQAPAITSGSTALINVSGGTNCRIEDSTFGGAWEALNAGIASSGLTLQRNNIIGGGWWIMRLAGSNVSVVNNFVYGNSNYGISCGISGQPTSGLNLKVWHNSIYIAHPTSGSQYCSLRWYSNAAGTEVVNNICFDNYPTASTTVFNMWCSGAYRPTLMNYNCLWSNQPGYVPIFAGANQTFASWQALGFDVNSIQADPQYVLPGASPPLLFLQSTSPCATAGNFLLGVLTDYSQAPRTPPVSIGAHESDGAGAATYGVFGPGCAGTAGVPTNTTTIPPQLGQTMQISFGNLPAPYIVVAVLGLSNTQAQFGPLPFNLGLIGAPGCFARVSLDVTLALVGAGGSATFPFSVPNDPLLTGFTFHTQGVVFDPPLNPFGFSTSAAATGVVGL